MSWNPKYALLLAASTIITYLSGLLIASSNYNPDENKRNFQRKLWVFLSFTSNLSILFFFKYFDFAVSNINFIFAHIGIKLLNPAFDVLLPVGISFYTFQALSYTMDIYRGEIAAEKNIAKYALFVSFFPQLVAGPIERSKNLLNQMTERHYFDYERVKSGLLLMLWGYFQKIVIADRISVYVNTIFADWIKFSGLQLSTGAVFFAFQIYCDFAGYSNISRGAGQIMGFRLMENFKEPYFASSIQDFWRRWHISLSTWFRDYLYIPLGGSRCSKIKKYRNILITFLASGLWHGASWNFFIWGAWHGILQITGEAAKPLKQKCVSKLNINLDGTMIKTGKIIMTFIMVDIGWIFFRAKNLATAIGIISKIASWLEIYLYLILLIFVLFGLFRVIYIQKKIKFWIFPIVAALASSIGIMLVRILTEKATFFIIPEVKNMQNADFIFGIVCIIFMLSYEFIRRQIGSGREWIAKQVLPIRWMVDAFLIFTIIMFGRYGGLTAESFIYFQF
jgi:D-alanyl-lipoteichoic acid acyltransferase DltB (MBOAT superfamily)